MASRTVTRTIIISRRTLILEPPAQETPLRTGPAQLPPVDKRVVSASRIKQSVRSTHGDGFRPVGSVAGDVAAFIRMGGITRCPNGRRTRPVGKQGGMTPAALDPVVMAQTARSGAWEQHRQDQEDQQAAREGVRRTIIYSA